MAFDAARGAILGAFPHLLEDGGLAANLQVSLLAGSLAGVAASLASQPGDVLFTKLANEGTQDGGEGSGSSSSSSSSSEEIGSGDRSSSSFSSSSSSNDKEALLPNPIAAFSEVVEQQGVAGLYAGALPRAVFAASLLALEFVIYDYLRALLKVSASDLQLTLDVLAGLN